MKQLEVNNVAARLKHRITFERPAYKIYVRKYHNVQTQMRIIFENKVLTIRAIINNPNYKELIEILADEENVHA